MVLVNLGAGLLDKREISHEGWKVFQKGRLPKSKILWERVLIDDIWHEWGLIVGDTKEGF